MEQLKYIAVIGAGVMGSEIALNFSGYGYHVILKDVNDAILEKAQKKIADEFRMAQMMHPFWRGLHLDDILGRICLTTGEDNLGKADAVIENVVEDWGIKKAVYEQLSGVCGQDTLYLVNTSCVSITRIGSLLPRPENVVGMHFMNPVVLKELVEVIRGYHTSESTLSRAKDLLRTIKKCPVVVNDSPGFVANRLSHLLMNEAAFLIQEQVAGAPEIDLIFKKGYGHSMGPLETADLIGLDTVVYSLEVLYDDYQDPKFRCCPLLKKMVEAGLLGRKSGRGFYTYN